MSENRDQKVKERLLQAAAEFFNIESNKTSLMTITRVSLSDRGRRALIYFTVFPSEKEAAALDFAKRKRGEFREFLAAHVRMRLPFIDFEIDEGEKNRQKIDGLLQNQ